MRDQVLAAFLLRQYEEGAALAAQSDILELAPVRLFGDAEPVQLYLARFHARTLVRTPRGIVERDGIEVGIRFPEHYLRHAEPWEVLSWLAPHEVLHPNIRPPLLCIGPIRAGTSLVELLHRVFEVGTFQRVTMQESNALDPTACPHVRSIRARLPVDRRPLKRWIDPAAPEPREERSAS